VGREWSWLLLTHSCAALEAAELDRIRSRGDTDEPLQMGTLQGRSTAAGHSQPQVRAAADASPRGCRPAAA